MTDAGQQDDLRRRRQGGSPLEHGAGRHDVVSLAVDEQPGATRSDEALTQSIDRRRDRDEPSRRDARRYATMMRAHTDEEDRRIFPLARNHLPDALKQRIDESFRRHRASQAAEQARCIALLEPLIGLITPARSPTE